MTRSRRTVRIKRRSYQDSHSTVWTHILHVSVARLILWVQIRSLISNVYLPSVAHMTNEVRTFGFCVRMLITLINAVVFLKNYITGCQAIGKELVNLPQEWIPFAPSPSTTLISQPTLSSQTSNQDFPTTVIFDSKTSTSASQTALLQLSTSQPAKPESTLSLTLSSSIISTLIPIPSLFPLPQVTTRRTALSDAAIAGIAVGTLLALAILIGLITAWRRFTRINKQLTMDNAKLADALNDDGVSRRIWEILNSSRLSLGAGTAGLERNAVVQDQQAMEEKEYRVKDTRRQGESEQQPAYGLGNGYNGYTDHTQDRTRSSTPQTVWPQPR